MKKRKLLNKKRERRARRVRTKVKGTASVPRFSVFRSHNNIYAQLIDDSSDKTLASASSYKMKGKEKKTEIAKRVGEAIAEKAKELGIDKAVFDRGSYRYHGRVKQVHEGIEIRRVTRVVAGGKRFSFRAAVVIGDLKGRVGFGVAKGLDVAQAVQKAIVQAKKKMITVPLKDNRTLLYDVEGKYGAAKVRLKPARPNHGLIAGGPVRNVLEFVGVKDVSAKILGGTTSKINNARAVIKALKKFKYADSQT
jgi:small subunit ribosomal protein S5